MGCKKSFLATDGNYNLPNSGLGLLAYAAARAAACWQLDRAEVGVWDFLEGLAFCIEDIKHKDIFSALGKACLASQLYGRFDVCLIHKVFLPTIRSNGSWPTI